MVEAENLVADISFGYDLIDARDGTYLGSMLSWFRDKSKAVPYQVGDSVSIPPACTFLTNPEHPIECIVEKVDNSNFLEPTKLYILPTRKLTDCSRLFEAGAVFEKRINGIDYDGSEWPPLPRESA